MGFNFLAFVLSANPCPALPCPLQCQSHPRRPLPGWSIAGLAVHHSITTRYQRYHHYLSPGRSSSTTKYLLCRYYHRQLPEQWSDRNGIPT
ncbi:hypothetical protein F4802DRAFT_556110 [Xylaria palmicola]|nr:hypothetical protein F4802DRAFT_556110 [Xylaria palmicola]